MLIGSFVGIEDPAVKEAPQDQGVQQAATGIDDLDLHHMEKTRIDDISTVVSVNQL
jgi:hypothetical protein